MAQSVDGLVVLVIEEGIIKRKSDGMVVPPEELIILHESPIGLVVNENYYPESNSFDNLGTIPKYANAILVGKPTRYRLNSEHHGEVFPGMYICVPEKYRRVKDSDEKSSE